MHIIIIISHHPKKFGTRSWVAFSLAYRSVINLSELFFGVEKQVGYSNSFNFDISINLQFLYNQILVRRHSAGLIFSNVKILKSVAWDWHMIQDSGSLPDLFNHQLSLRPTGVLLSQGLKARATTLDYLITIHSFLLMK